MKSFGYIIYVIHINFFYGTKYRPPLTIYSYIYIYGRYFHLELTHACKWAHLGATFSVGLRYAAQNEYSVLLWLLTFSICNLTLATSLLWIIAHESQWPIVFLLYNVLIQHFFSFWRDFGRPKEKYGHCTLVFFFFFSCLLSANLLIGA